VTGRPHAGRPAEGKQARPVEELFVDLSTQELYALFGLLGADAPAWIGAVDAPDVDSAPDSRPSTDESMRGRGAVDATGHVAAPLRTALQIVARPELTLWLRRAADQAERRFLCTPSLSVEAQRVARGRYRLTVFPTERLVARFAAAVGLADQPAAAGVPFRAPRSALAAMLAEPAAADATALGVRAAEAGQAESFARAVREAGGADAVEVGWLASPSKVTGLQLAWVNGRSGLWRVDTGAVLDGGPDGSTVEPASARDLLRTLVSALPGQVTDPARPVLVKRG
jgi:hypothetical protein